MAVERNVHALWAAKQTAKGTPATAATKRFSQVGGSIEIVRDDNTELVSDLDRFGDAVDYVNTLNGTGSPVIEAQVTETAYLYWLFCGQETFTAQVAGTSPAKHLLQPGTNTGFWTTWWKRVGLTNVWRQQYNDTKVTGIAFAANSQDKIAKVTPTLWSLDPGVLFSADPTPAALDPVDPMLFTEVAGTITIDGTAYSGISGYSVTVNDNQQPWYGDGVTAYDVIPGQAEVTVENVTVLLDATTAAIYNMQVYGTASPAAGAKPTKTLPATGSFSALLSRGAGDTRISIRHDVAGVKWTPTPAIEPSTGGGPVEIQLSGAMRKVAGQPAFKVTVETGATDNSAYTA